MKLLVRFAALVVAVMMVLAVSIASADYAVPGQTSTIEDLPERPEVPTMTTKRHGDSITVTMSEAPASMSALYNGEYVDMSFDEDNVAVVDATNGKSQIGTSTYGEATVLRFYPSGEEAVFYSTVGDAAFYDGKYYVAPYKMTISYKPYLDAEGNFIYDENGEALGQVVICEVGWEDMEYAYEGETQDGVRVCYGRFGECLAITVTVEGVSYFNNDVEPSKVEVTFKPLETAGRASWKWYVANITETYDEGDVASISATYAEALGGTLLHVDVVPAE